MDALRNHYVYRAYDEDGVLLYVGCSRNLRGRMAEHKHASRWFSYATAWRLVGPLPRKEALALERQLQIDEVPVFGLIPQEASARRRWRGATNRLFREHWVEPGPDVNDHDRMGKYLALWRTCDTEAWDRLSQDDRQLITRAERYLLRRVERERAGAA